MPQLRKLELRNAVIKLREQYPCMNMGEIGKRVGVCRERVRQILKSEKLPTRCIKQKRLCPQCGKELIKHKKFCSPECRYNYHHVLVECSCGCGELFRRGVSYLNRAGKDPRYNGKCFKNRIHYGKWFAKNYGFGAFPEHAFYYKKEN